MVDAYADETRGNRGLLSDDAKGKADQDQRESGEPRLQCLVSDGKGSHQPETTGEILRLIGEAIR